MKRENGSDQSPYTFEGVRRLQFTSALAATPAQRVAWLEAALRLAHATGALPRPRTPSGRVVPRERAHSSREQASSPLPIEEDAPTSVA